MVPLFFEFVGHGTVNDNEFVRGFFLVFLLRFFNFIDFVLQMRTVFLQTLNFIQLLQLCLQHFLVFFVELLFRIFQFFLHFLFVDFELLENYFFLFF